MSSIFGPSTEALRSLARTPLSAASQVAGVTSLFFRKPANVQIGINLTDLSEAERSKGTTRHLAIVQFDAVVSERHELSADVTSHPVEKGSDITDHIRKKPDELSIDGIVTLTPTVFVAAARSMQEDPVTSAYDIFTDIMDAGLPVDVSTKLRTYENMAITGLTVSRDASTGNVLDVSISLRKIRIISRETSDLPTPKNGSRGRNTNKNTKSTGKASKATEEKARKTFLASGVDKATQLLSGR